MKAITLLALRITTGALLIIWGAIKLSAPDAATRISDKYYSGIISADAIHTPLGLAQIILGGLVILGLFRKFIYPAQALVLVGGALAIWKYLIDPLGLYLLTEETRQVLFFPSSTVAIASLILIAFREYDTLSIDRLLSRS